MGQGDNGKRRQGDRGGKSPKESCLPLALSLLVNLSPCPILSLPPSRPLLTIPPFPKQTKAGNTHMATGYRILVADKLADEGLAYLKEQNADFDVNLDLKDEAKFAATVGAYDALIVRSGVKVTAKVLENPGKLRAIARAGVGVDNIHLPTATEKGILVMNTAEASTLSTAEHALALMMSLARKIPAAHKGLTTGALDWKKRSIYQGTQLAGKTLGVVGLGRIGQTVASRALAMEMAVLGFDPYYSQ